MKITMRGDTVDGIGVVENQEFNCSFCGEKISLKNTLGDLNLGLMKEKEKVLQELHKLYGEARGKKVSAYEFYAKHLQLNYRLTAESFLNIPIEKNETLNVFCPKCQKLYVIRLDIRTEVPKDEQPTNEELSELEPCNKTKVFEIARRQGLESPEKFQSWFDSKDLRMASVEFLKLSEVISKFSDPDLHEFPSALNEVANDLQTKIQQRRIDLLATVRRQVEEDNKLLVEVGSRT